MSSIANFFQDETISMVMTTLEKYGLNKSIARLKAIFATRREE